jgi:hypothetical protein
MRLTRALVVCAALVMVPGGAALPLLVQAQARSGGSAPRAEPHVPYRVGERLMYDVSWSNFLTAGEVRIAVESRRPSYGSTAYYVVAEARPVGMLARMYTLYYKADSLIDVFTLLPQRGSVYSREGGRQRMKTTMFDHKARQAAFEMRTASTMEKEIAIDAATHDALSAIFSLRARAPKPGERIVIPVSDSGTLYQVQMAVGQPGPVRKADGSTVQGLPVTPTVVDGTGKPTGLRASLWLGADGAYTPIRFEASLPVGRIVVALR